MKIELHCHTSEGSRCGQWSAAEVMKELKSKGYDAVVITNHFPYYYSKTPEPDNTPYSPEKFINAYKIAAKEGEKYGIRVFFGMEFTDRDWTGDFLVYGDNKFITDRYPEVFNLKIPEFAQLCRENGALLYQAHPFRTGTRIVNPNHLFGIEVLNGAVKHDSRNDIAALWADKFKLHRIGGSDSHETGQYGTVAVVTDMDVKTNEDLVEMLRTDNYRIEHYE